MRRRFSLLLASPAPTAPSRSTWMKQHWHPCMPFRRELLPCAVSLTLHQRSSSGCGSSRQILGPASFWSQMLDIHSFFIFPIFSSPTPPLHSSHSCLLSHFIQHMC
uniref:Putative secreted protein n=2 Tax=Anopheles triannulatus TaxID=58253 RepID=A0A2M4B2X2_9DIPT